MWAPKDYLGDASYATLIPAILGVMLGVKLRRGSTETPLSADGQVTLTWIGTQEQMILGGPKIS
jgi:hypothetical protein